VVSTSLLTFTFCLLPSAEGGLPFYFCLSKGGESSYDSSPDLFLAGKTARRRREPLRNLLPRFSY
jgi:hypothetical protein